MYQVITKSMFHDAFRDCNRINNFSYEAREALFEHFEALEEDEEQIELDIIAICCDYSEDNIVTVLENYNLDSLDELHDNTLVLWSDGENILYVPY